MSDCPGQVNFALGEAKMEVQVKLAPELKTEMYCPLGNWILGQIQDQREGGLTCGPSRTVP